MRRTILTALVLSTPVWAQANPKSLYQAWRQAAPALEETAGAPTAAFTDQVRASSEAAQTFFNARAAALLTPYAGIVDQAAWGTRPLATAEPLLTVPQEVQQLLAVAAAKIGSNINAFPADDKDPAIRRVRQSMERERAALRALMDSIAAAKGPLTELIEASDEAEVQRALTGQALASAVGRRTQLSEHVKREAADWSIYYKDLLEGALATSRNLSTSGTTTSTGPAPATAKITRPNPNAPPSVTRFTGEWEFPAKGLFYGRKPDEVELVIRDDNGTLSGALTARYSAPTANLSLQFQSGVQEGRTQTFTVPLANGVSGRIELIPGTAINLLEVNFESPAGSAPVTSANFVLVKR